MSSPPRSPSKGPIPPGNRIFYCNKLHDTGDARVSRSSETNCLDTGLLIEVWNKGLIWDKAMGHYWLPLQQVPYSNEEGVGQWMSLDAEQIMENGVVVGTRNPTGDYLLIDCRFELPYAGLSEDSDYTSEVNYPLVQHHEANGSASQYLSVAHQYPSPQRSSEISRENSYETNDTSTDQRHWAYDYGGGYPATQEDGYDYNYDQSEEMYVQADQWPRPTEEPLYYNSRPNKESKSTGISAVRVTLYKSKDLTQVIVVYIFKELDKNSQIM
ncbi:hypothetical protein GHT06_022361 [Daphnia sinensis]|uniref:Uncharacterized protein n=1 Tax=Daphnia sinensis TaxID=1820382 RepID=A0AAD5KHF5_9CRUS|nr:hypothetical protein GHT06_022361 [Daphnia sinensis]